MSEKERIIMFAVIEAYKNMPHLWNKRHENYSCRPLRARGYRTLLEIYKQWDPEAKIKTMKKRLENMRAFCVREEKKVLAARENSDDYEPSLWYYEAWKFLREPSGQAPTEDTQILSSDELPYHREEIASPGPSNSSTYLEENKKEMAIQKQHRKEEDWDIIGRSIGLQLRDLDEKSLVITQKIISDAIYYAKIGRLTEQSYIVLGNHELGSFYQLDHGNEDLQDRCVSLACAPPTLKQEIEYSD